MADKRAGGARTLLTPWGETLDREAPLQEYPRPQLRRESYVNLNGLWQYAICSGERAPGRWDGEIVVPFSPESPLSGVGRQVGPEDTLWYSRTFALPAGFRRRETDRVLLHFGAVDQECRVFVNDAPVGEHQGGYLPFALDITDALAEGENTLTAAVTDRTSRGPHAYGKQSFTPGGIWYTAQSGIWQTVWLEAVPENFIRSLRVTPLFDEKTVRLRIEADRPEGANIVARKDGEVIAEEWADETGEATILLLPEHVRPWSPEDPFLYDLTVTLGEDRVESYFALRKVSVVERRGEKLLALNDRPIFMTGVLDQGYWSDGLYTAPSDEAMIYDIQTMKDLGFNTLRKHIKIEPLRWYYHCDRLGMLVWQDLVSGGSRMDPMVTQVLPFLGVHLGDRQNYRRFGREDPAGRERFVQDLRGAVDLLYNAPSLVVWVPFNEGWGQFDSLEITQLLWEEDGARLVDHASGWHDQGGGDFKSRHVYFRKVRLRPDGRRVLALTEFGGYSLPLPGHTANDKAFGYRMYHDAESLTAAWRRLYQEEVIPHKERRGLSAAIYTQLSDVEGEVNGLLTYDRKVCKLDPGTAREINRRLRAM